MCPMGAGRWGYVALRFDGTRPEVPADWTPTLRAATGLPDLEPEVLDVARFTLAAAVATRYRSGPGFLVGDAAHRTTPVAGIGLNTAVHDGHELGWKLAWVARGLAGEALLDSHDAERGPVGLAAAERSLDTQGRPTDGLASALGHTHRSAVVDATATPPALRPDLAARPGERAPHAWIRHEGRRVSTLDLFDGRFTLLTGPDGAVWRDAAARARGVPLRVLAAAPLAGPLPARPRLRGARPPGRPGRLAPRRPRHRRPRGARPRRRRHPRPRRGRRVPGRLTRRGDRQYRRCSTSSERAGIRSRPPGFASRSLRAARARSGSAVSTTTCHTRP